MGDQNNGRQVPAAAWQPYPEDAHNNGSRPEAITRLAQMLTNRPKRSRAVDVLWCPLLRNVGLRCVLVPWRTIGGCALRQQLGKGGSEVVMVVPWARQFAEGEALQFT